MGTKFNHEKVNRRERVAQDRTKYSPGGKSDRGSKVLALRLIKQTFDNVKPLFKWTDSELYCLGLAIRKEWRRRSNPNKYSHGVREFDGIKTAARHPSLTGEFLPHQFKK